MPDINIDLAIAKNVNFTLQNGDTWEDFKLTMTENGLPIDLSLCEVIMQIKRDADDVKTAMELSTVNGLLRIDANNVIMDSKPVINIRPGALNLNIRFLFPDKEITYYKGAVIVEP